MGYQVGEWVVTDYGKTGYIESVGFDKVLVRYTLGADGKPEKKAGLWGAPPLKNISWPLNCESVFQYTISPMPIEKYYCEDLVELALATRDYEWLKELTQLRGEKSK